MKCKHVASIAVISSNVFSTYSFADHVTPYEIREKIAAAEYFRKHKSNRSQKINDDFLKKKVSRNTYEQKLNHADPLDSRTFQQRYWIYSHPDATLDSPVFYDICGESICSGIQPYMQVTKLAEKFKGHIVTVEHRYYGKSHPFTSLETENLKYLSTDAALEDLAEIQTYIQKSKQWTGPWIAIGGSYAGSLAAYYRLTYPHLVVGALASSAPVEAKADFEEYDHTVKVGLGETCAQSVREVVQKIESKLDDPEKINRIKALFHARDIKNNDNFLFAVADMASTAVQYGFPEFCTRLGADPENKLLKYAQAGTEITALLGITPKAMTMEGAESTEITDDSNARQWTWQTCTEYGYYQIAHSNPDFSMRSSLITLDLYNNECKRIFDLAPVDVAHINDKYFKPLLDQNREPQASRIFFTNGSTDPWQQLSLTEGRQNNANPLLSYMTIPDAAHCDDLFTNAKNPDVRLAQKKFEDLVQKWIQNP